MAMLRLWRFQIAIGVVFGLFGAFMWVRREARIAETPNVAFSPSMSEGEREGVINRQSRPTGVSTPTTSPSQQEGEKLQVKSPITHPSSLVTLSVPFVSQAPFRVWDLPYKEFCEEASVLTLHLWKEGQKTPPADDLDRALKDIQAWETTNLRTWEDTTAEETARVLREKFGHTNTRVVRDITVDDIKREIDAGRPVIVPAAGRELSSPYYRPPGPLYHMLVIIGYDESTREFITNDVGTNTKGAGFHFSYDDLYGAMGDWDIERGAPDTSQKFMIVVE